MATLREALRSLGLTTIFGRRLALDSNDYLVGPSDIRRQVEDLTTASSVAAAFGLSRVLTSGSSQGPVQYQLPAPVPGVQKKLALASTSTGSYQFLSTAAGAAILASSDGTTKALVNLIGPGGTVTLEALTTALWAVTAQTGGISYTTST